jgi:Predicted membrane protein
MIPTWVRDVVTLLARIGVGVVFVAHGWRKLAVDGIADTAAAFGENGVPLPALSAWLVALVELFAGIALIVGLAVPAAGVLLALLMLGAWVFVHAGRGIFAGEGGAELVIALGAASLLLAMNGAGRLSVDHVLGPRAEARSRHREHAG